MSMSTSRKNPTHRHHARRSRRDRTGDCRARTEIGASSRFDRIRGHRPAAELSARRTDTGNRARRRSCARRSGHTRPPRRDRCHRDRAGSQSPNVRSWLQVPGTNRIFRGALWRKKFRHVSDRRKTHRRARHGAHSLAQSAARAQAVRDSARRSVARGFLVTP